MNKNYDDEATQYRDAENEATQYPGSENDATQYVEAENEPIAYDDTYDEENTVVRPIENKIPTEGARVKPEGDNTWKYAAVGAASGFFIGSLGTVLAGRKPADDHPDASQDSRPHLNHPLSEVARHATAAKYHVPPAETPDEADDIEIVSVDPAFNTDDISRQIMDEDPEIEILGAVSDDRTGANIDGMTVSEPEVVLIDIDIDNDLTSDYIASALTGNETTDIEGIADIREQGIMVSDPGGLSSSFDNIEASDYDIGNPTEIYEG